MLPTGRVGRLGLAWLGACVASLLWISTLDPGVPVRYVAALHTVAPRFALELLHGDVATPLRRLQRARGMLRRATYVLHKRALPASAIRALPSNFEAMAASEPAHDSRLRNLVIFFLDTKRVRDFTGAAAAKNIPRIQRCFADGFRFEHAYTASTRTLTSFPSIYSSTHASTRAQERPNLAVTPYWLEQTRDANLVDAFTRGGFAVRLLTNRYYQRFFRPAEERPVFGRVDDMLVADETRGENEGLLERIHEAKGVVPERGPFVLIVHVMSHGLSELLCANVLVSINVLAISQTVSLFCISPDSSLPFPLRSRPDSMRVPPTAQAFEPTSSLVLRITTLVPLQVICDDSTSLSSSLALPLLSTPTSKCVPPVGHSPAVAPRMRVRDDRPVHTCWVWSTSRAASLLSPLASRPSSIWMPFSSELSKVPLPLASTPEVTKMPPVAQLHR